MSWFASLFSSSSKSSLQGRRKVLSSTQEAFSLPSPVFAQGGLFTRDSSLGTPDPESVGTPTFTYPPPSNETQYGYVPAGCAPSQCFHPLYSDTNTNQDAISFTTSIPVTPPQRVAPPYASIPISRADLDPDSELAFCRISRIG